MVIEEAQRNLIELGRDETRIRRRFQKIREAFADAEVTGFEEIIDRMRCHEKDRHVLAAAIIGGANQIVTRNLKDFPDEALAPYSIEAVGPDDFLLNVLDMFPKAAIEVITEQAVALRKPPMTIDDVLSALSKCGAPAFAQTVDDLLRASK